MKLFHRHNWIEIERFETPPTEISSVSGGAPERTIRELVFGITTILYRCSICSGIKTVEILGKTRGE